MQVEGINSDGNWTRLPRLYVGKDLPVVDKEEIATPEKVTDWEYLQPVAKEIVQSDDVCIANWSKFREHLRTNTGNSQWEWWSLRL